MKRVSKDQRVSAYSATNPPAIRVGMGETFIMETNDRFQGYTSPEDAPMDLLLSMTGPVFVGGAFEGDTLAVEVLDIKPAQGYGWIVATPGRAMLKNRITEWRRRKVPIDGDVVRFSDAITLPYAPMIGRLGVAPAGEPKSCNSVGPFGGAMSNIAIGPGATVYLPVFVDGALLTIEDVHAAMGDGESASSAVEMGAEVTLRCDIATSFRTERPVVVTRNEVMTTGEGQTMEAASRMAMDEMATLIMRQLGLDAVDAAMLISAAVDARFSYVGGPPYRAKAAIARSLIGL
ncbi:MAG TPA: acetamidase/formamidase family protein [Alphaproteobacteria bacterium]|nr:acetamidase/formamidase family protein [Alphaproteobacteria bacterium]